MVRDRPTVSISRTGSRMHSVEWLCCQWPWGPVTPQTTPISTFCIAFRMFIVGERLQTWYTSDCSSLQTTWLCNMTHFNFWGFIIISEMALARSAKFCTQGLSSLAKGTIYHPLKVRGWAHVAHVCMPLSKVNNAVDVHDRTYAACTYASRHQWCYTLRLKLHQFDLLWTCCKLVCMICWQQIGTSVCLLHTGIVQKCSNGSSLFFGTELH